MTPTIRIEQQRAPALAENPGYLAADRAASYAATQEIVVPKESIYLEIIRRIPWHPERALKLVEFGFGTGAFLCRFLRAAVERRQSADILAFDLSPEMGQIAKSELEKTLGAWRGTGKIDVLLVTGVNCLAPDFDSPYLGSGIFDAAVQLQFSHYAPNSADSWLGRKMIEDGAPKLTKAEWLARLHRWLRPGGALFDFDDFDLHCTVQNEVTLKAWDLWVLYHLSDESVQQRIAQSHPRLVQSIARRYSRTSPFAELLSAVERHRRKRRTFCREEVAPLHTYIGSLEEVFGRGNVAELDANLGFSHARFHLLAAHRAEH